MTSGMAENIIHASDVSKVYRVYDRPADRFWELLLRRRRHHEFKALAGVGFDVQRGESLAIIGENGAGKSTLLKVLAGIVRPSGGAVEVRGRVASILELGSGFHPEMTGRSNIVLNAAILGLSEARLRERLPVIIAFSELGEFIDQPVKCYSTGMTMRLGFAIATQVDPEILIIDEALAVGDGYFQKKCVDRLREMHESGTTFLFCSHAMYFVTTLCARALWLRNGEIAGYGPSHEVVREYEAFLLSKAGSGESLAQVSEESAAGPRSVASADEGPSSADPAKLTEVSIRAGSDLPAVDLPAICRPGEPLEVDIEWRSRDPELKFQVGLGINRNDGVVVSLLSTLGAGLTSLSGEASYKVSLRIPELPLTKGAFSLHVFLADEDGLHVYDQRLLDPAFKIGGEHYTPGLIEIEHEWRLGAADAAEHEVASRLATAVGTGLPS